MTYFSAFCEKPTPPSLHRVKRDKAAIRQAMLDVAGPGTVQTKPALETSICDDLGQIGLPLRTLENTRWGVSPPVAQEKLREAGLPYEGRRAGLIYSWTSILRAEGVDAELVKNATKVTHPHLFDDLVDTAAAAAMLGFRDASSIRKLIIAGELTGSFVRFGARGVYRFRPAVLAAMRKKALVGKIV
jgi:hypothetical protein